jgi:hypothetical protein
MEYTRAPDAFGPSNRVVLHSGGHVRTWPILLKKSAVAADEVG